MALKYIAVDGCTLAHKAGSTISGGVFTITSVPSTSVKAEDNGAYKTPLQYTFSGGNAPGCSPGSVATTAPQTISTTAQYVKADDTLVMLVDDFGTMTAQGTDPSTGAPVPVAGPVEISDAGQSTVEAQ